MIPRRLPLRATKGRSEAAKKYVYLHLGELEAELHCLHSLRRNPVAVNFATKYSLELTVREHVSRR